MGRALNFKSNINKKIIAPICLANNSYNSRNLTGRMAVITGWGRLGPGRNSSDVLMQVKVPIISQQTCDVSYTHFNVFINNKTICAGYPEGDRNSCAGDSGGPLSIWSENTNVYTQVGLVSTGQGCGSSYFTF